MTVAAFRAIASTPHTFNGQRLTPEALALPPAVLVHAGHGVSSFVAGPVAVALPFYSGGVVAVDAVFASHSHEVAESVGRGERSVSVYVSSCWGPIAREVRYGVLAAVDLVSHGADPGARITSVTDEDDLSDELRRCRAAFDAYLADLRPQQLDFLDRVQRDGVHAFEPLASVVAGIREHHAAQARRRAQDAAAVRAMVRRTVAA